MTRTVTIVGAGPGAPDLITVRGARRLAEADAVFYDGLVPVELLEWAPANARRVPVSRRPGSRRVPPDAVADLVIAAARGGERVVRLRAGDPFVLARGAEELLALVRADVPFEIVPGLTSAIAAATLAGVPLTHRGVSSAFVVLSGHAPEAYTPVVGSLAPQSATIVVLMGLAERAGIARVLIDHGWRPDTPATVLVDASQPSEIVWTSRLDRLGVDDDVVAPSVAGVLVIGDVVDVGVAIAQGMRPGADAASASQLSVRRPMGEREWQL